MIKSIKDTYKILCNYEDYLIGARNLIYFGGNQGDLDCVNKTIKLYRQFKLDFDAYIEVKGLNK